MLLDVYEEMDGWALDVNDCIALVGARYPDFVSDIRCF